MTTIDIAIATHRAHGINRTAEMIGPPQPGVRYVISWQHCEGDIPRALMRDDVEVVRFGGNGVSANRNCSLEHCRGDIVLMADDDLDYAPDAFRSVIDAFDACPDIDFATFRFTGNPKSYPAQSVPLTPWPRNYSVTTFEIAARRKALQENNIRFDLRFGPGSGVFESGEDEMLALTMLRKGMSGRFFPITICRHEGLTTGFRQNVSRTLAYGFGGVIGMMYPVSGALRAPLKALRLSRAGRMRFFSALIAIGCGYLRSLTLRRPWKM